MDHQKWQRSVAHMSASRGRHGYGQSVLKVDVIEPEYILFAGTPVHLSERKVYMDKLGKMRILLLLLVNILISLTPS